MARSSCIATMTILHLTIMLLCINQPRQRSHSACKTRIHHMYAKTELQLKPTCVTGMFLPWLSTAMALQDDCTPERPPSSRIHAIQDKPYKM